MAAGTDIHRLQAFIWNRIWRGRLNVEQMYNDAVKLGYVKSRKLFNDVYTDVKDGYNAKYPDYRVDESNSEKKSSVTLTEAQLRNIVAESVKKALSEEERDSIEYTSRVYDDDYFEKIPAFDVIEYVKHGINSEETHEVLSGMLYDKSGKPVGKLNDLHFRYDPSGRHGGRFI